ncbi:MAG: head GIN domain-containing protein [Bacteroidales bacterium]|jgi:hypothetical protein|nr:head GIN domain-containing protein [Bacteroidales bacterium]
MKIIKNLTIVLLLMGITTSAGAQFRRTVYGNKRVVKTERNITGFDGVRVSSGIDVYLSQGNDEKVIVEADENLHEYIMTELRNGIIHVYTNTSIRDAELKRVYITMPEIRLISTTSAGDVIGETPVRAANLRLSASSAGDIKLEVYADRIELDISSSGDMTLTGEAGFLEASLSSAGDLNAFELKVKEAEVSVSSAGDAEVYVSERIRARASSAGDISYRGNPRYVDAHSSSAGSIHRR